MVGKPGLGSDTLVSKMELGKIDKVGTRETEQRWTGGQGRLIPRTRSPLFSPFGFVSSLPYPGESGPQLQALHGLSEHLIQEKCPLPRPWTPFDAYFHVISISLI